MWPLPWNIRGWHWSYRAVASHMSLLNYPESVYNYMISLAASRVKMHWWNEWYNASVSRALRTWGRRHVYHAFAHAFVFRLPIPAHHTLFPGTEGAHWHYDHPASLSPAHLHLLWICSRSERSGELDRINIQPQLCASHYLIDPTSWDVLLARYGLKTYKSSSYYFSLRLETMF